MNITKIAEQIKTTGYIVLDNPLRVSLSALLLARCQNDDSVRFHAAQIGRGLAKSQINTIRGDVISWLDDTDSTDQTYLAWMETLRSGLNEALFLGLFDYECHYAIYDAGSCYAKHSDVFSGKQNRLLSTVYYLNEDWHACDGGELVLFDPTGETAIATVNPTFGTMIIFLSESFPHEVLMAHAKRRSIAGWFRGRGFATH
jgi:SM-20-related protein